MTIQERFKKLIEQKSLTQAYACRSTGISASRLTQWLKGSYQGDNKKINEAVESFINKEYSKISLSNSTTKFIETSIVRKVFNTCKNCHYKGELGVVFGDAGLGKTTAVEKYSSENPDVILIKVNPSYTKKFLIQELHKSVGYEGFGAIYIMLNDIISRLKQSSRLIIVDQAEYLSQSSLELLRAIYDEAKIGLVLVGMPKLYFNLKGKKGDFKQLFSRIGYKTKLENLQTNDSERIVKSFVPSINESWEYFHNLSFANTRSLCFLIKRSIEKAELNDRCVSSLTFNEIRMIGEQDLIIEA